MLRQPYDLDAILIGDVREGREAAEMLLAAGTVLARRGHSVGIVPLADRKDRTGVVLQGLVAAVRRGSLCLIEGSEQRLWCRLAIVAGAPLLAGAAATLPPITARQALVLVTETVLDRQGKPRFDLAATTGIIGTQLATEQHWCPADLYIRRQLQEAGLTALLHPEDWPPALDVPAWRLPRAAPAGRRAVLGHAVGRGTDPLGPDRASILKRYPAGDGLPLRLHGAEDELLKALDPLPAGWQIVPPAMAFTRRFLARLDFFLSQPERIPARPPRALLEAMAVGRVALLAPGFRALLGEGLAYRTPSRWRRPSAICTPSRPSTTATSRPRTGHSSAIRWTPCRAAFCPSSIPRARQERPRPERSDGGSPSTPPTASALATWPGCWRWRSAWVPRTIPSSSLPATPWP